MTVQDTSGSHKGFARNAKEAWKTPRSPLGHGRQAMRRTVLAAANVMWRPGRQDFVRCLYSHAIFPEHRDRMRTIVRTLKQTGEFIDTSTLVAILRSGEAPRGRYYHLSFDDGFANIHEEGGPIFVDEGVPHTIFIPTDLIGASFDLMSEYNAQALAYGLPVRPMDWDQVRASIAAGAEIGCHTRSHARLSAISGDPNRLHSEVVDAKSVIERETDRPCTSFAWPFGKDSDVDDVSLQAISDAGFEICFSAERGRVDAAASSLLRVPRHQIELHWPVWENLLWARGFMERAY